MSPPKSFGLHLHPVSLSQVGSELRPGVPFRAKGPGFWFHTRPFERGRRAFGKRNVTPGKGPWFLLRAARREVHGKGKKVVEKPQAHLEKLVNVQKFQDTCPRSERQRLRSGRGALSFRVLDPHGCLFFAQTLRRSRRPFPVSQNAQYLRPLTRGFGSDPSIGSGPGSRLGGRISWSPKSPWSVVARHANNRPGLPKHGKTAGHAPLTSQRPHVTGDGYKHQYLRR